MKHLQISLGLLFLLLPAGCGGASNSGPVTPEPMGTPTSDAPEKGAEPTLTEEGP